jgi:FdhD protein
VDLAREFGLTLVGFLRERRFNLYAGDERIRRLAPGGSATVATIAGQGRR